MISEDAQVPRKTWPQKSKTFRNSFQMVILKEEGGDKQKQNPDQHLPAPGSQPWRVYFICSRGFPRVWGHVASLH